MARKTRPEHPQHYDAYLFWYWHPKRSVSETAKKFEVYEQTIYNWAKRYGWSAKAAEWDEKFKAQSAAKAQTEAMEVRQRHIKLAERVQENFLERLKPATDLLGNPIRKPGVTGYEVTATDAQRWAAHELLVRGMATHRAEVTVGRMTIDNFVASVVALLRRVLPEACPHCKTNLGLPSKVVAEMMALSSDLENRQREEQARAAAREEEADRQAGAKRVQALPAAGKPERVKPPLDVVPERPEQIGHDDGGSDDGDGDD